MSLVPLVIGLDAKADHVHILKGEQNAGTADPEETEIGDVANPEEIEIAEEEDTEGSDAE